LDATALREIRGIFDCRQGFPGNEKLAQFIFCVRRRASPGKEWNEFISNSAATQACRLIEQAQNFGVCLKWWNELII
jgi:hypothetical protein